jgi:hypothetical protein
MSIIPSFSYVFNSFFSHIFPFLFYFLPYPFPNLPLTASRPNPAPAPIGLSIRRPHAPTTSHGRTKPRLRRSPAPPGPRCATAGTNAASGVHALHLLSRLRRRTLDPALRPPIQPSSLPPRPPASPVRRARRGPTASSAPNGRDLTISTVPDSHATPPWSDRKLRARRPHPCAATSSPTTSSAGPTRGQSWQRAGEAGGGRLPFYSFAWAEPLQRADLPAASSTKLFWEPLWHNFTQNNFQSCWGSWGAIACHFSDKMRPYRRKLRVGVNACKDISHMQHRLKLKNL